MTPQASGSSVVRRRAATAYLTLLNELAFFAHLGFGMAAKFHRDGQETAFVGALPIPVVLTAAFHVLRDRHSSIGFMLPALPSERTGQLTKEESRLAAKREALTASLRNEKEYAMFVQHMERFLGGTVKFS